MSKSKSLALYRRSSPSAVPGTLLPAHDAKPATINVIAYSQAELIEHPDASLDSVRAMRGRYPVLWIDVSGLADANMLRGIGDEFGLHRLALEDVFNVHQRPKVK